MIFITLFKFIISAPELKSTSQLTGIADDIWKETINQREIDKLYDSVEERINKIKEQYFTKINELKTLNEVKENYFQLEDIFIRGNKRTMNPKRLTSAKEFLFRNIFYEFSKAVLIEGYDQCFNYSYDQFDFDCKKFLLNAKIRAMKYVNQVKDLSEYQEFKYEIEENFWNLEKFLLEFAELRMKYIREAILG